MLLSCTMRSSKLTSPDKESNTGSKRINVNVSSSWIDVVQFCRRTLLPEVADIALSVAGRKLVKKDGLEWAIHQLE
jgi:hypothetical protein